MFAHYDISVKQKKRWDIYCSKYFMVSGGFHYIKNCIKMQSDLTYLDKLDKKQYLTIKCVKTKSLIYIQYNKL